MILNANNGFANVYIQVGFENRINLASMIMVEMFYVSS